MSARRGARPQRCGILSLLLLSHVSVFISRRTFHRRLAALGVSSLFNLMKIEKFKTICPCPSQQPEHHGPQRRLKGTRVQGVGGAWHPVPREQSCTMLVCHLTAGSARETHSGEALGENKHTLKFSLENSILESQNPVPLASSPESFPRAACSSLGVAAGSWCISVQLSKVPSLGG